MKKVRTDKDKPADPADNTATDERDGKTVRGWEDIDKAGHDKGYGDKGDERDGTTGS